MHPDIFQDRYVVVARQPAETNLLPRLSYGFFNSHIERLANDLAVLWATLWPGRDFFFALSRYLPATNNRLLEIHPACRQTTSIRDTASYTPPRTKNFAPKWFGVSCDVVLVLTDVADIDANNLIAF